VPAYVNRGFTAVFQGMTSTGSLVGISLLATLTVLLWRLRDGRAHDLMFSLALTALAIYVGLGIQRGGFGLEISKSTLTHHFRTLREAGVIRQERQGTTKMTWLRRDDLDARFPGLLDAVLSAAKIPA